MSKLDRKRIQLLDHHGSTITEIVAILGSAVILEN
jgi:hypothetical protein